MRHSGYYGYSPSGVGCDVKPKWPTILTIDDDPNVSQALKRRFSRYRVTLLQAQHGTHGIWLAMTRDPDVIITDLRMPQGRGQDLVAYLRRDSHTRHIPIIVLTGVYDDDLRHRMLNLGVAEYFSKPVSFEELRGAVERFIDLAEKREDEAETVRGGPARSVARRAGQQQTFVSH